jgi:hypothetical protein
VRKDVIVAAALCQVYNISPVAEDLSPAAILADACFKGNEVEGKEVKDALVVGRALLPKIKELTRVDMGAESSTASTTTTTWTADEQRIE